MLGGVDRAHGVGVHVRGGGHLADAGEALPGVELAADDPRAQVPCELHPHRDLAVAVEADVHPLKATGC